MTEDAEASEFGAGFSPLVRGRVASGSPSARVTATLTGAGKGRFVSVSAHAHRLLGAPTHAQAVLTDTGDDGFTLRPCEAGAPNALALAVLGTRSATARFSAVTLARALGVPDGERREWTGTARRDRLVFPPTSAAVTSTVAVVIDDRDRALVLTARADWLLGCPRWVEVRPRHGGRTFTVRPVEEPTAMAARVVRPWRPTPSVRVRDERTFSRLAVAADSGQQWSGRVRGHALVFTLDAAATPT